jgi:hypothetical protein
VAVPDALAAPETHWGRVDIRRPTRARRRYPAEQNRGADGVYSLTKDRRHLQHKPFAREAWRVRRG